MSKVRVAGHSLHPMLVVFPLGLLVTSVVWDLCFLATSNPMWGQISFWTIMAGIVGALFAAVPGFMDWLAIPDGTRAKRVGLWHMGLNLILLMLFVVSATVRYARGYAAPPLGAMLFGWVALCFGVVSSWLGGELVERLGIGVYEGANPDATSSLHIAKPAKTGSPRVGPREPTPSTF